MNSKLQSDGCYYYSQCGAIWWTLTRWRQIWCVCSVKTVWSIPERFRGELLTMGRYTNLCTFTFTFNLWTDNHTTFRLGENIAPWSTTYREIESKRPKINVVGKFVCVVWAYKSRKKILSHDIILNHHHHHHHHHNGLAMALHAHPELSKVCLIIIIKIGT